MMILKPQKKYQKFLKNNYKESPQTIWKLLKKEGTISKPPVESYELSEDQKRIRKIEELTIKIKIGIKSFLKIKLHLKLDRKGKKIDEKEEKKHYLKKYL